MKYYEEKIARDNFDQILDEAQKQDITITKDGEKVAVVIGKKSSDVMRHLNSVLLENKENKNI